MLKKANLIQVYEYRPEEDYKYKDKPLFGGRQSFKMVTPKITKAKLNEINKKIGERREELKEMEKLLKKANKKFEKMYEDPKKRKIFKGIK